MFAANCCLPKFQGLSKDAGPWCLKICQVRNFPLDFLGLVRNIPRAEFSSAEKTLYRIPPPLLWYSHTCPAKKLIRCAHINTMDRGTPNQHIQTHQATKRGH